MRRKKLKRTKIKVTDPSERLLGWCNDRQAPTTIIPNDVGQAVCKPCEHDLGHLASDFGCGVHTFVFTCVDGVTIQEG